MVVLGEVEEEVGVEGRSVLLRRAEAENERPRIFSLGEVR